MSGIVAASAIAQLPIQLEALQHIPYAEATSCECLIFHEEGETLSLLTTNNHPEKYHEYIDTFSKQGRKVTSYFTDTAGFTEALKRYTQREHMKEEEQRIHQERIRATGQEAISLLKETFEKRATYTEGGFLNEILTLAYQAGASDVHFQTEEQGVRMRLRKDGLLQTLFMMEHEEFSKYMMKIKFLAGVKMNITHQSQDGRFQTTVYKDDKEIHLDVRASFLPSLRGESIVLRFLDDTANITSLASLGMQPRHVTTINDQLEKHHGLILVAGPTGSGKTTTVYTLLHKLNHPDRKIITLEDPVEYEIDGITQSQINEREGYTFEEGLKGILRHDPDIIVVGEMRTLASAQLAINAAITGHLVISTVHTNSALEAITRLLNMGIPPFMLAASLNCIIAQRLVRKATVYEEIVPPASVATTIEGVHERFKKVLPTEKFPYTGHVYTAKQLAGQESYAGRVGVFECLPVDTDLKNAIVSSATNTDLYKLVQQKGYLDMQDDAWIKMVSKQTTVEEIQRVL